MIPLCIQQFYCSEEDPTCPMIDTVQYGRVTKWSYIQNFLVTGKGWEWYYLGWLVFSIVLIRVFVAIIVQKVSHVKR